MNTVYDLIIIGSGPAGLAAAIYGQRARLNTLIIEKELVSGGQVLTTYEVDNYPGLPGINGFDLGMKLREHADKLGASFITDQVIRVETTDTIKTVVCQENSYQSKTILIATGAAHKKLGVPGEEEFAGMGVSYCATCDGAFFRNKVTAVVGGGDVALEDAIFLARTCEKVYLIHRRHEFRGAKSLQEAVFKQPNIEVIWDTVVEEIEGEGQVQALKLQNRETRGTSVLPVNGVFIAVGITPNNQGFEDLAQMEGGYFVAGEDCQTTTPGIFAAGDVRTKQLRQIVTAVADGANAVTSVERYLTEFHK